MSYEKPRNTIDQTQAQKSKKKSNKLRREVMLSANSESDPTLLIRVLAVSKQGENYLLNYKDLYLKDQLHSFTEDQLYTLQSLQFSEAVKALWHNIKFVLSVQNFGTTNKKGETIDMEFFKNLSFKSNPDIRSNFSHNTISKAIDNPKVVASSLVHVLEKSQELVASYEENLTKIKQHNPEIYEKLASTIDTKVKLMSISIDLVTALKNNKINMDEFKDQIYYGRRSNPPFEF